jgi:hypothetical protein
MSTPLLVRFARSIQGEDQAIPGRYDAALALRVFDTPEGPVPVVSRRDLGHTVTRTDHGREADDKAALLAAITKTSVPRESEDRSLELPEPATALELASKRELLLIVTKTLHRQESDDEPTR